MVAKAATNGCASLATRHPVKASGTVTSHPKSVFCALSCTALAVHYTSSHPDTFIEKVLVMPAFFDT